MGKIIGITYEKEQDELFACPVCGKEYKTQEGLDKHIAEKHPEPKDEPPKAE